MRLMAPPGPSPAVSVVHQTKRFWGVGEIGTQFPGFPDQKQLFLYRRIPSAISHFLYRYGERPLDTNGVRSILHFAREDVVLCMSKKCCKSLQRRGHFRDFRTECPFLSLQRFGEQNSCFVV